MCPLLRFLTATLVIDADSLEFKRFVTDPEGLLCGSPPVLVGKGDLLYLMQT